MDRYKKLLIVLAIGLFMWMLPAPEGVSVQAWQLVSIMTATIVGFMINPLPIGGMAFLGMLALILTNTLSPGKALSGFSNTLLWLIVMAFMFSKAFMKTQLGNRLALTLLMQFGDSPLKIGYVVSVAGSCLSPVIPSGTARAGGIVYPILRGICTALGSEPDKNPEKAGRYLVQTYFQAETYVSYLFMTSMAGNVLVVDFAKKTANTDLTWTMWALAAALPGLVALLLTPLITYMLCRPTLKKTPEARQYARRELEVMGPMTLEEKQLIGIFFSAIVLWATGDFTGLSSTTVGLLAVGVMLVLNILTWDEILLERGGWDTLIWMGVLVCMAGQLVDMGFIAWLGKSMSSYFVGMNWIWAMFLICAFFNWTQYAFASSTAHMVALYTPCLTAALAVGCPPMLAILLLAFLANTPASLTQYTCGFAPIYFNSGYFSIKDWCRLGFIQSLPHFTYVVLIGPFWWKFLGLW